MSLLQKIINLLNANDDAWLYTTAYKIKTDIYEFIIFIHSVIDRTFTNI